MKIRSLKIRNFRKLDDISLDLAPGLNVIVGPNSVGKTTLLEAVRVHKALLFARYSEEPRQVLQSIGAANQHIPWGRLQIETEAIAGDPRRPVTIDVRYTLDDHELAALSEMTDEIAMVLLRNELGHGPDHAQSDLIQFLSTEVGRQRRRDAAKQADQVVRTVLAERAMGTELVMDAQQQTIYGTDPTCHMVAMALESRLSPRESLCSYFPADRHMPVGDGTIQLGAADLKNQAESHLGNAPQKYARLKQTIVGQLVLEDAGLDQVRDDFNEVIQALMPGKTLKSLGQRPNGHVRILVEETDSGRVFDVDGLSSGEKGLLLTFFLIRKSVARGGVVLLDEPEIHLNPGLCSRIVPYLVDKILAPSSVQAIVCTHSAEILASTLHHPMARLFDLRDGRTIAPVRREDTSEIEGVLHRLGSNVADMLFYKGQVFVEGDTDAAILASKSLRLLAEYKLLPVGGRQEIEKSVRRLQSEEKTGRLQKCSVFILDGDNRPCSLHSTQLVRVLQLDRYCIENYLIDSDAIYNALHSLKCIEVPGNRGEIGSEIERLAMSQLNSAVVRDVYGEMTRVNCRPTDFDGKPLDEFENSFATALVELRSRLPGDCTNDVVSHVRSRVCEIKGEKERIWRNQWRTYCNGKLLMTAIHRRYGVKVSLSEFKQEILENAIRVESPSISQLIEQVKSALL